MPRFPLPLVLALLAAPVFAAPPDPAAVFPADALAYAEIGHPAKTADALAELLKGTPLADTLALSHDRRDTLADTAQLNAHQAVQSLALLVAPELLADVKKLHAVSAALLGFDPKTGRPRYALAVQFGDSTALPLVVRTYLTTGTNVRRVGKVGDVPVYQNRGLSGGQQKDDGEPRAVKETIPAEGADEPTYAYLPGLLVIGSGKAAVADVIGRWKKPAADSLAVKLGKADRGKAGVFVWADLPRLEQGYAAARRKSGDGLLSGGLFVHLRMLFAVKTLSPAAGHLGIEPDGFTFTLSADTTDPDASPLIALLAGGGTVSASELRACAGAWGGVSLALTTKEKRAKAVVSLADALHSAAGDVGATPGERLAELVKGGWKAGSELFPLLKAVTVLPPELPPPPKPDQKPLTPPKAHSPTLCLTLETADAAKAWEAAVPQLVRWVCGLDQPPAASSEQVNGLTVRAVVIPQPDGRLTVHYCRNGDVLGIGTDRKQVAAAVSLDPKAKPPAVPPKGTDPAAFAFLRFDRVLGWVNESASALIRPLEQPVQEKRLEELIDPGSELKDEPPKPEAKPKPLTPQERLTKVVADVPALTAGLTVRGRTLTADVRWRCDKKTLAELIEAWMIWAETPAAGEELPMVLRGRGGGRAFQFIAPRMIGD
jgi:hypothetical protein